MACSRTVQPRGRGAVVWSRNPEGLFAVGMLPACQFTHGHLYMLAEVPQRLNLDIFVVHATYQVDTALHIAA